MTATVPALAIDPPASGRRGLGLLLALRRDPLGTLSGLRREHGPLVRLRTPRLPFSASSPVYLVSEPDAIGEALTRTHHEYGKGRRDGVVPLARLLGQGLLTSDRDLHRRQRRLIQPMFHQSRIAGYAAVFAGLADLTAARWPDGGCRDARREMTELTLAIIARTVFDVDLDDGVVTAIRAAVGSNRSGPLTPAAIARRARRARADLDSIVYRMIADRRASGTDGHDVLHLLLAVRDAETGAPMPDELVRDEAMTLLLAGHETTANALAWALHLLSGDPVRQERLRGELPGRVPELDDVAGLGYTAAVWRETLRLYPPAWLVPRRLTQDRVVAGYPLVAGSILLLSPYVTHRDPRFWPEPDAFRPERWLADPRPDRPRYAYFPFGGGPRQCIGNEFADLEGVLTLAALLRRVEVRPAPGTPAPVPRPQVTLRPAGEVSLLIRHR
jgi:cytochrome P450